jgi:hypothetical protein
MAAVAARYDISGSFLPRSSNREERMLKRRRFKQTIPLKDRLAAFAKETLEHIRYRILAHYRQQAEVCFRMAKEALSPTTKNGFALLTNGRSSRDMPRSQQESARTETQSFKPDHRLLQALAVAIDEVHEVAGRALHFGRSARWNSYQLDCAVDRFLSIRVGLGLC